MRLARDPASLVAVARRHSHGAPAFSSVGSEKRKSPAEAGLFFFCGPYQIRTGDLLSANEALYQLS